MERDFSKPFVVVAALIERGGKYLLVEENWGDVKGLWNTPAGWLDLGESLPYGVIREVKEESGYDFLPTAFLGVYSWTINQDGIKKQPVKFVFTGEISGKPANVNKSEISQIKWWAPEEIEQLNTLRDKNIRQMVRDHQSGKSYPLDIIKSGT